MGHMFYQCKLPITSYGIILFRMPPAPTHAPTQGDRGVAEPEFLMIRRKDTFGYIDFVRGKYSLTNQFQIQKCINEMSLEEKQRIITLPFNTLWSELWGRVTHGSHKSEEAISAKRFEVLRTVGVVSDTDGAPNVMIEDMVRASLTTWDEQEWEFPKGRRNFRENDIDCAMREFEEETGIAKTNISVVENIVPYKEYFIGSNFKSYKHKFYVANVSYDKSRAFDLMNYQRSEVSKLDWKTVAQCKACIRPYSVEKIRVVENVRRMLDEYSFYS